MVTQRRKEQKRRPLYLSGGEKGKKESEEGEEAHGRRPEETLEEKTESVVVEASFFSLSLRPQFTLSTWLFPFQTLKTMSSLKLQRRLAASVLGVGKRALWLDPSETAEIALANSRELFFLSFAVAGVPAAAAAC